MNSRDRPLLPVYGLDPALANRPERIVGLGFRCSMSCLRARDQADAGQACARLTAAVAARLLPQALIAEFAAWALAVEASAERPVAVLPIDSAGFCRDECLAISLVAACQHDACPALKSCAFALLGSSNLGRALVATGVVARTLSGAGCRLHAHGIVETVSFAAPFHGARSGRVH